MRINGGAAFFASSSNPCAAVHGANARNSQNCSVREAPNVSKAPARNNAIASSDAGEQRRQKSESDTNGRPSSIRPSNPSDNPLIMHKGTRILFPSTFSVLPAEHGKLNTENLSASPFTPGPANRIPNRRASIV